MAGPSGHKVMTADDAAALVPDHSTLALIGGGGGLMEASTLFAAIERRFLATGSPSNLWINHALGFGDRVARGLNRFAHRGMVRRVVGGHWAWSPKMQQLAADNEIEAYALPGGVMMQLWREISGGRPGLITRTGLGTFVDPRLGGGAMNEVAPNELVELIEIDGETWLRYKPFPVDVAVIRGSRADTAGNVTLEWECADLDVLAVALAARNSGGRVLVQVREVVEPGSLPAHSVAVPAPLIDAIVPVPDQMMTYDVEFDLSLAGAVRAPLPPAPAPALDVRHAIAARASLELYDGALVNFGFGMPDAVARLVDHRGLADRYHQTIEHGTYGGRLLEGAQFGFAKNPTAMIDAPSQFDLYGGGGLDIAFLGFGEIDRHGNVNASKIGGVAVGPGGFIDIAQSARKVVFCGTFDAKGADIHVTTDGVAIRRHGAIPKVVADVAQITFSGPTALSAGQEVRYVTERAVLELRRDGLTVTEIAPGIDLHDDVLAPVEFDLLVAPDLEVMPTGCYLL